MIQETSQTRNIRMAGTVEVEQGEAYRTLRARECEVECSGILVDGKSVRAVAGALAWIFSMLPKRKENHYLVSTRVDKGKDGGFAAMVNMMGLERTAPVCCAMVLLLWCHPDGAANAQPLVGDRPGEAETTSIVFPGALQTEGGIKFQRQTGGDEPNANTLTAPQLLLRVGLLRILEFRFYADGFVYEDSAGPSNSYSGSDLELGTKLRFLDQDGWLPTAGLLVTLNFPTGGSAVTSDGIDPRGIFLANWELGERVNLDTNLGCASRTQGVNDSTRVFQVDTAVSLEGPITQHLGAFVEYFSTFRAGGKDDEHSLAGGLIYLVHDNLQLDASAGVGLNRAAPDFFIGCGVVSRFRMR